MIQPEAAARGGSIQVPDSENMSMQSAKISVPALLALETSLVISTVAALLLRGVPVVPIVFAVLGICSFLGLLISVPAAWYSVATDRSARSAPYLLVVAVGSLLVTSFIVLPFLGGGI
ncbi:hypothetical protein NG831_00265 [Xanthomonas sacchari]|uniref:hypothetical protein n=1 Tax=Xanthomonas sacchari TaxID=56458 RepID=UPI002256EB4B|nr:hypothetical protein [Xanthomonas sacchari]UYK66707.1 hypothetical protein NG831_00265 [Xanthomonas sacchari]